VMECLRSREMVIVHDRPAACRCSRVGAIGCVISGNG
jgi:hypothetical protein